ncbi:TonB-dependent Receptor Plug Domain protein [Tsuneonella dongtanensis]|uniref:TonB-dependent Receptor Plug Domain protein n=1 Tax=Tsuneonella dongtanensis TaxID=692370 RepID=A0A1B2AAZ8_9SPHN|nr:TonB-dependent receptor plug domain-containing protein [Tsuneonella dongtanensis]ANY19312.1 TonB-dependent Receptor Plug Domain protein [Tsuneonella dongtanensis]
MRHVVTPSLLMSIGLVTPAIAGTPSDDESAPGSSGSVPTAADAGRQVFTPTDFAQFSPKNAADMIQQIPGFQIRDNENLRGLGQATGNVLFNGQRPSTKSDDLRTLLSRIPASTVERIEILDGATVDIPGLSGQVANVVYTASKGLSGQFSWEGQARAHFADPLYTRGAMSVSGRSGSLEYEFGLDNNQASRGAAGGITTIADAAGTPTELRDDVLTANRDQPKASAKLTLTQPNGNIGHLNGHYQQTFFRYDEDGVRRSPGMPDRLRTVRDRNDTWNFEVGGDYEFAVGPGRLKMIGLRRFSHEPFGTEVVIRPADLGPPIGEAFAQVGDIGETIARAEYSWKMLGGDWQLSSEAAFNTLDNVASLGTLDAAGEFVYVPFPSGTGGVTENRYETLLSFGRSITSKLSFQIVGGAEHSTIEQTGGQGLTRSFFRPKGTFTLSWTPSDTLDASLKIRRRVLQLSFYDFLARAFLNDGVANAGNVELRPQQDWSFEGEINKKLGDWGSQQFQLVYRNVSDYVDVIPVPGGESTGNIDKAWAAAIVSTSTIKFDPLGLAGVKLDGTVVLQTSSVRDPFTGEKRQWRGFVNRQANFVLRHDIPGSDWAWGGEANHNHVLPRYRRTEIDRNWEGPWFVGLFVEHKDVFGLTVRADAFNLTNARQRRERTVYTGLRGATPIAFTESRDRLIGPIFSLSVRGNF